MEKAEYSNIYENETSFWWYRVLHQLVEKIVRKKAKNKNIRIFDAGCGTGRVLEILKPYGEVSGIDFSEDAVYYSHQRGMDNVERDDLNNWTAKTSYDLIVSLDVLYHAGIEDDLAVLQKFYNALEKNGSLILNLAAFEILRRPHDLVVHTKRRYKKKILSNQLHDMGFEIEKAGYRLPHVFLIILFSKLFRKSGNKENVKSDIEKLPKWINEILFLTGILENFIFLKLGSLPFGSSLFIVAKKT